MERKNRHKHYLDIDKWAKWKQKRRNDETRESDTGDNGCRDQQSLATMLRFFMSQFMPNDKFEFCTCQEFSVVVGHCNSVRSPIGVG
jgi:hypothetical protein